MERERLTAQQVIDRAKLDLAALYVHTDTGSMAVGAEWAQIFRDQEESGAAEFDSAFDPEGDGAHLIEVESPAAAMGRKGGKSKSAAKSAAARKNAAKARKAIDPEKRAKAVAASNRRRAKK